MKGVIHVRKITKWGVVPLLSLLLLTSCSSSLPINNSVSRELSVDTKRQSTNENTLIVTTHETGHTVTDSHFYATTESTSVIHTVATGEIERTDTTAITPPTASKEQSGILIPQRREI